MSNTFKNFLGAGITTATTIYTAPAATQSTVIGMNIANASNTTATVSVQIQSGSTTVHIVKGAPIPTGGALVPVGGDQKLVLVSGDLIKVTSDQTVDVIVSALEIA